MMYSIFPFPISLFNPDLYPKLRMIDVGSVANYLLMNLISKIILERVHEYGELFQLYRCEECGMRASDLNEIRQHVEEYHRGDISLESMGITQLPTVTKLRKQDFLG